MKKKNPEVKTKNVIPMQIWPSYLSIVEDPETTVQDKADFLDALLQYSKGNFDFVSDNRFVRSELRQIRVELKLRWEKYVSKIETLKENGSKGGKAKAENQKTQSIDNERNYVANAKENVANANKKLANVIYHIDKDKDLEPSPKVEEPKFYTLSSSTPSAPSVASAVGGGEGFSFFERFKAAQKEVESLGVCEPLERIQGGLYSGYIDTLARFLTAQGTKERKKVVEYIGDFEKEIEAGIPSKLPEIIAAMKKDPILCGRAVMEENAWKALKEWDSVRKKFSPEDISEIEAAVRNYPTRDKWNILQKACRDSFGPTINSPKAVFLSKFKKPKGNGN